LKIQPENAQIMQKQKKRLETIERQSYNEGKGYQAERGKEK